MVTAPAADRKPGPWWVRSGAPWTGELFAGMTLAADSLEETRIQAIREAMLPRYRDGKRRLSLQQALLVTRS